MEGGKVTANDVADEQLRSAISLIESNGYYVVRFPDRDLRRKLLKALGSEPKDLRVITTDIYGPEHDAKDQYRVRSCLRRMRDEGLVVMDGRVLIDRIYVGTWRLA